MPYYAKISRLSICISLLLSCSAICAAQEKKKLAFAILIDNTGSMRLQFELVKGIGKGVVHQVYNHGPVSLFGFESEGIGRGSRAVPTSRIEQTQDEQLLDRTIDNAYVEGGLTTLLDAIELMAERLRKQPETDGVIILITDGEDRISEATRKEVIRRLKERNISIYAFGLVKHLDDHEGLSRRSDRSKAVDLLNSLTKETGGRVVFPKSGASDVQSLIHQLALPIQ